MTDKVDIILRSHPSYANVLSKGLDEQVQKLWDMARQIGAAEARIRAEKDVRDSYVHLATCIFNSIKTDLRGLPDSVAAPLSQAINEAAPWCAHRLVSDGDANAFQS
jgi:hypothetical protein